MIEVIVKEYDGWFDVLETADLYGVVDMGAVMEEMDHEKCKNCRLDMVDATEDYCMEGLARLGVVFEL